MFQLSENNWYYWQYNNGPKFGRKEVGDIFTTTFSPYLGPVGTFKEELLKAARSTVDTYSSYTPSILFSGGMDSELMLRIFLEIGVKPNVYIVRYENDYNIYDVSYAITICSILNVDYQIIDINLKKFYENEAEAIASIAQNDRPSALVHCKFIELVDGLPIFGAGDLNIKRIDDDYSRKSPWVSTCHEYEISWEKYARFINKPAIPEWFKWTPGLVLSFLNLPWFKTLTDDGFYGKLGTNTTKIIGYRSVYKDILLRDKKTGFEQIQPLLKEFESFLKEKNKGLIYRDSYVRKVKDLELEIKGILKEY